MKSKLRGELWHEDVRDGNTYPQSLMVKTKKGWIHVKNIDENEDKE